MAIKYKPIKNKLNFPFKHKLVWNIRLWALIFNFLNWISIIIFWLTMKKELQKLISIIVPSFNISKLVFCFVLN